MYGFFLLACSHYLFRLGFTENFVMSIFLYLVLDEKQILKSDIPWI
jgi:hypothetical protein